MRCFHEPQRGIPFHHLPSRILDNAEGLPTNRDLNGLVNACASVYQTELRTSQPSGPAVLYDNKGQHVVHMSLCNCEPLIRTPRNGG
jgi:hypothetical protein